MILSIIILSLPDRTDFLHRLLSILNPQLTPEVEVFISLDARVKSIGRKRNEMIAAARGRYVVSIDDDDTVAEDYIESILTAAKADPDYIAFKWVYAPDNGAEIPVISSKENAWTFSNNTYYRGVVQTCPIKRWIARAEPFPDHLRAGSSNEDFEWSKAVHRHVLSEVFIDKFLYRHEYRTK